MYMKETWHYDYQECLKLKLKNQVEMISHRFNFPLRSFPKRKLRRPEDEARISSWSVAEYAPNPPVLKIVFKRSVTSPKPTGLDVENKYISVDFKICMVFFRLLWVSNLGGQLTAHIRKLLRK